MCKIETCLNSLQEYLQEVFILSVHVLRITFLLIMLKANSSFLFTGKYLDTDLCVEIVLKKILKRTL